MGARVSSGARRTAPYWSTAGRASGERVSGGGGSGAAAAEAVSAEEATANEAIAARLRRSVVERSTLAAAAAGSGAASAAAASSSATAGARRVEPSALRHSADGTPIDAKLERRVGVVVSDPNRGKLGFAEFDEFFRTVRENPGSLSAVASRLRLDDEQASNLVRFVRTPEIVYSPDSEVLPVGVWDSAGVPAMPKRGKALNLVTAVSDARERAEDAMHRS